MKPFLGEERRPICCIPNRRFSNGFLTGPENRSKDAAIRIGACSPHSKRVAMHPLTDQTKPEIDAKQEVWLAMAEHRKRFYTREEDFLDEYESTAYTAAKFLGEDWYPNPSCDESLRKQTEHLREKGKLKQLVFDCAFVDEDGHGFVSVQIHLKSSARRVIVGVRRVGNMLVVEKIGDEETP